MARRGQLTAAGSTSLGYDVRGNLTSNGSTAYVYDHENRLVYASGPVPTSLFYDPLGRLWKTQDSTGANRYFLYDGAELIAEYNNSNALVRRFVWGSGVDEPIIQDDDSSPTCAGTKFLHADRLGSIVATADCWGARLAANSYDEYGNPGAGNVGRFQYTGQMWMPELGLQYSKARMYSPALGRFLQTDPIGTEGGINLYAYVLNDPVNMTDSEGLDCDDNTTVCGHRLNSGFAGSGTSGSSAGGFDQGAFLAGLEDAIEVVGERLHGRAAAIGSGFRRIVTSGYCSIPTIGVSFAGRGYSGAGGGIVTELGFDPRSGRLGVSAGIDVGVGVGASGRFTSGSGASVTAGRTVPRGWSGSIGINANAQAGRLAVGTGWTLIGKSGPGFNGISGGLRGYGRTINVNLGGRVGYGGNLPTPCGAHR